MKVLHELDLKMYFCVDKVEFNFEPYKPACDKNCFNTKKSGIKVSFRRV